VIATRTVEVAYVDMRYSNGFSIGWANSNSNTNNARSGAAASSDTNSRGVGRNGNV
jgi:hypothetical protein